MKRVCLISLSLVFFCFDQLRFILCRLLRLRPPVNRTVLVYHDIDDEEVPSFTRQMRLVQRFFEVLCPESFPQLQSSSHSVLITFDDAFEGVFRNAIPVLTKYQFPCVVFVPVACLGQHPGWKKRSEVVSRSSRVASGEMLKENKALGVMFGSHTLTHVPLREVDPAEARKQIFESKLALEGLLGSAINFFAFPYGDYAPLHIEACRTAGYRAVFTAIPRFKQYSSNSFVIPRIGVCPKDGILEFFLKAHGAYRWIGMASVAKQWLRSLGCLCRSAANSGRTSASPVA